MRQSASVKRRRKLCIRTALVGLVLGGICLYSMSLHKISQSLTSSSSSSSSNRSQSLSKEDFVVLSADPKKQQQRHNATPVVVADEPQQQQQQQQLARNLSTVERRRTGVGKKKKGKQPPAKQLLVGKQISTKPKNVTKRTSSRNKQSVVPTTTQVTTDVAGAVAQKKSAINVNKDERNGTTRAAETATSGGAVMEKQHVGASITTVKEVNASHTNTMLLGTAADNNTVVVESHPTIGEETNHDNHDGVHNDQTNKATAIGAASAVENGGRGDASVAAAAAAAATTTLATKQSAAAGGGGLLGSAVVQSKAAWKTRVAAKQVIRRQPTQQGVQQQEQQGRAVVIVPQKAAKLTMSNVTLQQQQQPAAVVRDPLAHTPKRKSITPLPFSPMVPYLGVLVDAGRQYYSIPWLKRLVRYLHYMRFNLIHFRLTDDQAFAVRLESRPELAKPSAVVQQHHLRPHMGNQTTTNVTDSSKGGSVYSPAELKELVHYAAARNVTIMPEINVPGHAGAWQIPGMLVPCPNFICGKGYGIPLNINHPQLLPILKDVIKEVMEIFYTSPFLHLGGDEVHMSMPCFHEAGIEMFDYGAFERDLAKILYQVGIKDAVRWEMTGQRGPAARVVSLEHYWLSRKYETDENGTAYPFFASQGLYFDSNKQKDAFQIYESTREYLTTKDRPTAIVAGAFELGMDTWVDRNVMGRLLAVAMGASGVDFAATIANNATANNEPANATSAPRRNALITKDANGDTHSVFYNRYFELCKSLAFDETLCSLYGKPSVPEATYEARWNVHWNKWKRDICNRLTTERRARGFTQTRRGHQVVGNAASTTFWNSFTSKTMDPPFLEEQFDTNQRNASRQLNTSKLHASSTFLLPDWSSVPYRGLSLDLVRRAPGPNLTERLEHILDVMVQLGLNLLQLRLMDDLGFVMQLDRSLNLQRVENMPVPDYDKIIPSIVEKAFGLGIMVMPEISITTRSGGWSESLAHVQCPNLLCDEGQGLAIDLTQSTSWPTLAVALKRLRHVFSSKFFHLGYDERQESAACFNEARVSPDFDLFEEKLHEILRIAKIPQEHVVRWENTEQKTYARRAGTVTHYRLSDAGPSRTNQSSSPWFVSTGLALDDPTSTMLDAWNIYEHTRSLTTKSPTAILASVEVLDADSWTSLNINGRLLAFSMGLSPNKSGNASDAATFRQHYNRTCHSLTVDDDGHAAPYQCEMFGTVSASKSWWKVFKQQQQKRVQQACNLRTREFMERIARKGVLVE